MIEQTELRSSLRAFSGPRVLGEDNHLPPDTQLRNASLEAHRDHFPLRRIYFLESRFSLIIFEESPAVTRPTSTIHLD